MNKKELIEEVKNSTPYYRVTMDGKIKDLRTIPRALNYIKKMWNKYSTHCAINKISFKK